MKIHQKKQQGFTLIEMLVTISIATILTSIAVPSFTKMVERNRISSGTNEFLSALILARSEAVKRSQSVSVCVSNAAQTACDNTLNDYAKGWIVFTDCNGDGVLNDVAPFTCDTDNTAGADAIEEPIKVHGELKSLSIVPESTAAASLSDFIEYDISGRSDDFNLHVGKANRPSSENPNKTIDLSRTGRATTCDYSATGC